MTAFPDFASRSAALHERAMRVLPGGNSRLTIQLAPYQIYAASGSGCTITDIDGVARTDFFNNATSLQHGHCHPKVVAAIREQAGRLGSVALATEAEILLAELLCGRIPAFERIRFANSGTEGAMQAIKAARAYTGRSKIAKCEGGYHGTYDYLEIGLGASPENPRVPYAKGTPAAVLDDVVLFPFNDESAIERILGPVASELAAVIIDPLPAAMGLAPPDDAFMADLREFTRRHGIVLIFDEVISFRLGHGGAQEAFGVAADLSVLGKTIGGGLPVGAVAGRADIMAVFDASQGKPAVPHAGTFNANPLTMAAGRAAMELMTKEAFAGVNALGAYARRELARAIELSGLPFQVNGRGSLFMLHLHGRNVTDYRSAFRSPAEKARHDQLQRYFLNNGFLLSPLGLGAISTPMGPGEIDRLAETLLRGLREINWELANA